MSRRHWMHSVAVGIAIALAVPALGHERLGSQKRPHQKEEERKADKTQPADEPTVVTPSLPPFIGTEPTGEAHNQNRQNAKQSKTDQAFFEWGSWFTRRDTIAQWIMAGFGVVATVISVWAVILLRSTLKTTRDAVAVSRRGTDAADAAVAVTRDTAEWQLRSYLCLEQISVSRFETGQTIEVETIIKNTGQTPARNVVGYTAIMCDRFPLDKEFPEIVRGTVPAFQTEVGHGGIVRGVIPTKTPVSAETIQSIINGNVAVYVWGEVPYKDIFGKEWFTRYRKYMTRPQEGKGRFRSVSDEGNESS